ncbi:TPA: glycosyltransferase family 25 protein [Pasteurella multocida]|uniref:Beta-1,4 galactosyltransferase n=2 Tax=Pasteurella multocida TaxID=747 RepID=D0EAD4_PASMD|nr:glycosyltransferase family 25 protein [Pasteurella multocida]ACX35572.1 beta-1,4 galactosyltransferase [Pasteurella multocida]APB78692.1 beta-1,4 galactosyltransferase [Pasteurella multocida]ERL41407.1 putative lipooligosaccharide biosynthesis protein [Pasteurella multocida subsp. multocida str. PMTB]KEZ10809.1 beta-1,4 galactosyltransferase [Pasteurella multocida]KEZ11163.1 beta-1,4 galactosyltransferase [Pasteurella multocida]
MSSAFHYVISLASAVERRQHISEQFSQYDIPFQFFDAISPSPLLNQLVSQFFPSLADSSLTDGEKGCFISHLSLWHKCVEKNLPYIVVFEDDILLGKNADKFLIEDEWFFSRFNTNDVFIVRLETFLQKVYCQPSYIKSYYNRELLTLKSTHFGTAGYIISLGAAKFLLSLFNKMHIEEVAPIDELLFNKFLERKDFTVYQFSPALCIQELQLNKSDAVLLSQLELERSKCRIMTESRIGREKKKLKDKIIHVLTKPKRMLEKKRQRNEDKKITMIIEFE